MPHMEPERIWNVVTNPAWRPLTNADVPGYVVLAVCAAALVGLTLWTYVGNPQTTPRRMALLICLRLLALLIAIICALRPALAVTEQPRLKSTLIVVLDTSESMSMTDEYDRLSRFEVMRRVVDKCDPLLKQLADEQQVAVQLYHFGTDFYPEARQYHAQVDGKNVSIGDWLKSKTPDEKRTDFGTMLAELYRRYQGESNPIRGLVIISDGGNNAINPDPIAQAMKLRGIGCPIYPFIVGRTDTKTNEKDVGFVSIAADPSPVPVKADLTVKAVLNAMGFSDGPRVKIKLTLSRRNLTSKKWEEIPDSTRTEEFRLFKQEGNQVEIVTKAPDKPGQVRVTLEIVEGPDQDRNESNNTISTFLTVTKEGVRVLVIDRLRPELKFLRYALASDKRIDYVELVRQTDEPPPPNETKKFDILNEAYDVIVLGDVSPGRLNSLDPKLVENIARLVRDKGVGLIMTGGLDSFGGTPGEPGSTGWANTAIAKLLPVEVPGPTPQKDAKESAVEVEALANALSEYIMKLDPDPKKNAAVWTRLGRSAATRLGGYTYLGRPKPMAKVFAEARRDEAGGVSDPLLVGQEVGNGARVLAFGADQTWKWVNLGGEDGAADPDEGVKLHARFWKQVVLWLAHQDEVEGGTVWVRPDLMRLAVNGKNTFRMGIKDKHGDEVANPKLRFQVLRAGEEPDPAKARPADRDQGKPVANFEAKEPGEYRVIVWGEGQDPSGTEIKGDAEAWFDVYADDSDEKLRPAANDEFLLRLEATANGVVPDVARKADTLPRFLKNEFIDKPLKQTNVRPRLHPDWRRNGNSWFLPVVLIAFVAVLGLEWGLRRVWGLV